MFKVRSQETVVGGASLQAKAFDSSLIIAQALLVLIVPIKIINREVAIVPG